jgi:AraC family transcriptional activator of pobA
MKESDIQQDISLKHAAPGSLSKVGVPRYVLYGDAGNRPDWFVNLEALDRRCRDRGWVIKPHVHPRFAQIMIVTQGAGEMHVEGVEQPFRPGSVMMVPPHRIHGFRYDLDTQGWVLTIENHFLDDLLERAPALRMVLQTAGVFDLDLGVLDRLEPEIAKLEQELRGEQVGSAIASEIHLLAVLLILFRHWPMAAPPTAPGHGRADLVERYRALLETRFREQPSVADMAQLLGVSVAQLRLACGEMAGLSPLAILHERLLAEARRYLAYTALPVAQISDELGFSEASYFTRFFVKETGETPTAWRRSNGFRGGLDGIGLTAGG